MDYLVLKYQLAGCVHCLLSLLYVRIFQKHVLVNCCNESGIIWILLYPNIQYKIPSLLHSSYFLRWGQIIMAIYVFSYEISCPALTFYSLSLTFLARTCFAPTVLLVCLLGHLFDSSCLPTVFIVCAVYFEWLPFFLAFLWCSFKYHQTLL